MCVAIESTVSRKFPFFICTCKIEKQFKELRRQLYYVYKQLSLEKPIYLLDLLFDKFILSLASYLNLFSTTVKALVATALVSDQTLVTSTIVKSRLTELSLKLCNWKLS